MQFEKVGVVNDPGDLVYMSYVKSKVYNDRC